MIEENFDIIYKKFRIDLYRRVFSVLGQREGSLTATDFFSVETIYLLGSPTITEFANALSISQPNATYRVKQLIEKGYVVKSETDKKNTYRLGVTEKFMRFYHEDMDYGHFIFKKISQRLSAEEIAQVDGIFEKFIGQIEIEEGDC